MSRLLYGGTGLLGLWLWDKEFPMPKGHLGARVHSLWVLKLVSRKADVTRYYAGFVVLPGLKTLTEKFRNSLKAAKRAQVVITNYDEIKKLQYLEDPLCGDTGSFPLPIDGDPEEVANRLAQELNQAGHDLAALDPAHFREPHAHSISGDRH